MTRTQAPRPNRTRPYLVQVSVSKGERDSFRRAAKAAGTSVSAYVVGLHDEANAIRTGAKPGPDREVVELREAALKAVAVMQEAVSRVAEYRQAYEDLAACARPFEALLKGIEARTGAEVTPTALLDLVAAHERNEELEKRNAELEKQLAGWRETVDGLAGLFKSLKPKLDLLEGLKNPTTRARLRDELDKTKASEEKAHARSADRHPKGA
jgi:hypothetical protein